MAVQSHGVVVERGDVGLAARQAGRHVAGTTVGAHAVVAVDVGGVRDGFLQGSDTQGWKTGYIAVCLLIRHL